MGRGHWKHIYAMLASDGKVKIGTSKEVHKRAQNIEYSKEVKVVDFFETEMCSNPFTVEKLCHDLFKGKRVFGEWFLIDFDEAVNGIKLIFEKYARFEETSSDITPILTAFFGKDATDKDEALGMLTEIILRQSNDIDRLTQSIMSLSKSVADIANAVIRLR